MIALVLGALYAFAGQAHIIPNLTPGMFELVNAKAQDFAPALPYDIDGTAVRAPSLHSFFFFFLGRKRYGLSSYHGSFPLEYGFANNVK